MKPHDLARLYLEKAWEDELAALRLAPMEDVSDAIVGFHAHQAVEKSLKAVLALNEVRVRKIHDIAALSSQLAELGVQVPHAADEALELMVYSVLERYPTGAPTQPLDRTAAIALATATREWAVKQLDS